MMANSVGLAIAESALISDSLERAVATPIASDLQQRL
jgi:hypothetical protein